MIRSIGSKSVFWRTKFRSSQTIRHQASSQQHSSVGDGKILAKNLKGEQLKKKIEEVVTAAEEKEKQDNKKKK